MLGKIAALRPSQKAWAAIGVGVFAYEIFAGDGELLSHQTDRWLETHPVITAAAVIVTAAHLLNILHPKADPFHLVFLWRGRAR